MTRIRATAIAALLALVPATTALAEARPVTPAAYDVQSRGRGDRDRDPRDQGPVRGGAEAPRADLGSVVRRVSSGRDGRMLGVSPRGDTVVVRWEYPGGRVADITVDARSGRIVGER